MIPIIDSQPNIGSDGSAILPLKHLISIEERFVRSGETCAPLTFPLLTVLFYT